MQRIRDRQHFYGEIKWNKVSAKKLPLMIDLVNVFLSSDATFSALVADKTQHDVIGRFGGPFKAYEALARQLVRDSVRRGEVMFVIADEYSTPPQSARRGASLTSRRRIGSIEKAPFPGLFP
jgi:hypothetical protein